MLASFEAYKTFYAVAKTGSVSRAAQQLYISQPAVSQTLKNLEESLKCKLFVRTSKGVKLTAEGKALFPFVEKSLNEIEAGERLLSEMLDLETGEIRIGASDLTLQFYLLPYLEEFHRRYPKIKITVSNATTPETINSLKSGKIDFGVVSSPVYNSDGLEIFEVSKIQDIFVASERFSRLKDRVVELSEIARLPIICLEKDTSSARRSLDVFFAENGVELAPEIELATSDLIVKFTERNLGVGVVTDCFAQESLESGSLFKINLSKEPPKRNICIATPEKAKISAAGKKFLKEVLNF